MGKKVYVGKNAKSQLETSDDASTWSKKIEFREKPEPGFNYQMSFSSDTVAENGFYHPDRDQDLDSTIESIVEVKGIGDKKITHNKNISNSKKKTLINKLGVKDFENPMFDKQSPRKRKVSARPEISHLIEDDVGYWDRIDTINDEFEGSSMDDSYGEAIMEAENPVKKEIIVEGLTFTDNFNKIGYTYHELDGIIYINCWDSKNKKNVRLFEEVINSSEEFDKLLKKADKKIRKLGL